LENKTTIHNLDQPQIYRIEVQGYLPERWSVWFEGMELEVDHNIEGGGKITAMIGAVPDQAALHGLLARIRDLGLVLLRVEKVSPETGNVAIDE
jgi:hypothetical protein